MSFSDRCLQFSIYYYCLPCIHVAHISSLFIVTFDCVFKVYSCSCLSIVKQTNISMKKQIGALATTTDQSLQHIDWFNGMKEAIWPKVFDIFQHEREPEEKIKKFLLSCCMYSAIFHNVHWKHIPHSVNACAIICQNPFKHFSYYFDSFSVFADVTFATLFLLP